MTDTIDGHELLGTGIQGLDEVLRGGLPAGRMYLVEGDPGTGKTTLALQFLLEGAQRGESCLYVTLSETESELAQVAESHGWSLGGIAVCDLSASREVSADTQYTFFHPSEVELAETTKAVLDRVERTRPTRVVFDSLSEMRLLARDALKYRRQVLALKQFFSGRQCTVLLLDDRTSEAGDRQLESLAHGVIRLELATPEYGEDRRRLRVTKLRGVKYRGGFHDFAIEAEGLLVFPRLAAPQDHIESHAGAVSSGSRELDDLLGGGIPFGTSTLVIGPAGAGKTTVALAFATGAATGGVPAAVFTFDESRASMLARADALGMAASELIAAGSLHLREINPAEMTPGQFAHAVCDEVEQQGARVVVIDSLNGYLASMASADSLTAHLHELLSYLSRRGTATLVIMSQHGLVGAHMPAPVDVSYIADSVVLLRFFEAFGAVRKAISVIKKRSGVHEDTIRELRIDGAGLRVGAVLREFRGVLTGSPEYHGASKPLLEDRGDDGHE
jgi:circadian clock protein KaiC